jgi:predicted PurR-regulated permease PerM
MATKSIQLPSYLKALAVLLLLIVLVFILIVGKAILIPLALGGFFAVLFTPLSLLMERYRFPRVLSCTLSLLLMIAITAALLSFVVGNLIGFSKDFADVSVRINALTYEIDTWTAANLGLQSKLADQLDTAALYNLLNRNSGSLSSFAINAIGSLSSLVLIPIFMFFFLLYRDHLANVMVTLYPTTEAAEVKQKIGSLRRVVLNYVTGVGKVMVILAVLNISAYSIIGVDHAVFFGLIGAVLNIIPYIGPFIGALLPAAYAALTMDSLLSPLLILAVYQAIQLLEGNFLTPKIVGGQVNLNAFVTFLGLLLGASIWGVAGMILIIPILAILREIFELSDSTKPFALLLGEERSQKPPKPISDEEPTA